MPSLLKRLCALFLSCPGAASKSAVVRLTSWLGF
jgi:hypothetical protein